MEIRILFSIFNCLHIIPGYTIALLREGGNHVYKNEWYARHKYDVSCSIWNIGRCTLYKAKYGYNLECEPGWTTKTIVDSTCDYALCDGKANYNGACNINYYNDYQRIRGIDRYSRSSGGSCNGPDYCVGCNDGFYSDGPYCRICTPISNCYHRRCATGSDQKCVYCEGEVVAKAYWRAYTPAIDGGRTCQKACSWRSDSTRCYPGTCQNELAAKCQCTANFGGTHCHKILNTPDIKMNHAIFYDSRKIEKLENDPNYVGDDLPVHWTNFVGFKIIETKMAAKYLQPTDTRSAEHYVKDFRVGLVEQTITLSFYKTGNFLSSQKKYCSGMNRDQPIDSKECAYAFSFGAWPSTLHDDKIIFSVAAKNGGYVVVNNRENKRDSTYFYEGSTRTREFEFHWDLVNPYHCSVTNGASCSAFVSVGNDITDNPTIAMSFGGWDDDLAGLHYYEYQVFDLGHDGTSLIDGQNVALGTEKIEITDSSITFTLSNAGAYSIHFSAYDKAGNYKTGRGLMLFDDKSVVDKLEHKQTICDSASENTTYAWVVTDTNNVKITWTHRFINSRHVNNRWLNKVKTFAPSKEISVYEDLYGNRTDNAIDNIHAIVDFQVSYEVHGPSLKESRALTSVSSIHNQYDILPLNWIDGDRLTTVVKAIDVLGMSNQDTIVAYRDATPPIIENLWLTRGDRVNIYVHRIEDFKQMTIEWLAYDDHSGLDSVYWKLYDKYSGIVVLHGHEDILAQGETSTLEECQNRYGSYPRGANCYCTNFMGCYHRHFQVKPEIKVHGGLILNFDSGIHDYDYHIDISVTSKANITTLLTKKITIDTSPPHTGVVHDGLPGNPEVDYQQEQVLNAYWDQFFDRESGVFFYQYIVDTTCANKADFDLEHTHPNIVETYNTYGSHTASTEGTYFFTVVAYNRAVEPSDPICSDGVTIDTSTPGVREVVVNDAHIMGGLIKDATQTNYYILASDRTRRIIPNPTADCVSKATIFTDSDLYPAEKFLNGTLIEVDGDVFCSNSSGAPSNIGIVISKSSMLEMSWDPIDVPAKVYNYEVGLASVSGSLAPNLMSFQSTKQFTHHRVMHGNIPDGTRFYIIIKTISKSNIEGITSIGPCLIDTTPPDFTGTISTTLSGNFLIASWPENAFTDSEEFYSLTYEYSIGHQKYGTDVQGYKPLQGGSSCSLSTPPSCVASDIINLDWYLHGHHTYYINIKVANSAGLVIIQGSSPYVHDVQRPSEGVVLDIDTLNYSTDIPLKDIEDVDFQTDVGSMSARWSKFTHPHLNVTYSISIGSAKEGDDVVTLKNIGNVLSHKETGLSLTPFKKYYFTVKAVSTSGSVSVSSDGVTIVTKNAVLSGVMIYDGQPCNMTAFSIDHHQEDHRFQCADDIDIQMSLNSIKAYWTVPEDMKPYTIDALIAIEQRSQLGDIWTTFSDFDYFSTIFDISIDDLTLSPGTMYRVVLRLCARTICFQSIHTDGFMVIAKPPTTGGINVEHRNITEGGGTEKLMVTFDLFYDPDIENSIEKYDAVDKYEYAITDNSIEGKMYMTWTSLTDFTTSAHKRSFEVNLTGTMDFSKCKRFSVRGYNKAKLYSVISKEIKYCKAFNPILIKPNIIIDAVGEPDELDGIGKTVYMAKNGLWSVPDQDYTPYKNVISAVWPTLRHRSYNYAVIDAKTVDVTTYYRQVNQLSLRDPCSHPDALKCGYTESEFANIEFTDGQLTHGTRYTVCVHANPREIHNEKWIGIIPEVNACSDGIIVDLTPPTTGNIWIGNVPTITHQTVNTAMYVNWDGFYDIEEYNNGPHSTGIKEYILGIGTTSGGNDVFPWANLGIVQYKALLGLRLQNGYSYYATLKAIDFANREVVVTSNPVIVDITPPVRSDSPITITSRHITSTSEIEVCWKNVFTDLESGIDYYLWSIGSQPGYTDIMSYLKVVAQECGSTDKNNPLHLLDGHYYFINVRAFNKGGLSSLATSWAYQVDTAPPTAGHVYDGQITLLTGSVKDIDYQTETKFIYAYWEGFHDAHSIIEDYYISMGTCPKCEDILPEQAIGITQEYTLKDTHLGSGLRYYTTVTACNTATLCTSVTSDGVVIDNSPPTTGVVQDGTGLYDTEYQSTRTYISAKWYGFTDPQSGLQKYVWRAGTNKGGDDIISATELHLTELAALFDPGMALPVNKKIYVTVRAYNKAGLWAETSSNGFIVDDTPPIYSTLLTFAEDFGIVGATQIYRTSMKVKWAVDDPESFIKRQYLSISSHIGGEFDLSSQNVNGIARSYVFSGLHLHDGVTYYVTLISCNGAEICVNSTTPGMLVDSTPPSRGMFAINTDHAANLDLSRHADGWMFWSSNALYLAWLGFSDVHSGVEYYKVTVGSSYMASDLCKDPNKKYPHTTTNTDHGDEGKVQLYSIDTYQLITYDTLYVTVWAVNGIGLRSQLIHSAFRRVPGGALDLIRRCDSISCEGHCVCAPQDQKCLFSENLSSCVDTSIGNQDNLLLVSDTNGYTTTDLDFSSSANILRGQWIISQTQGLRPLWYEWSVGYTGYTSPKGIYNIINDKVWQDSGQLMDVVFTMEKDKSLTDDVSYTVFVKVWYTTSSYAIFTSDGIKISEKPPAVTIKQGKVVIEKTLGKSVKDEDFVLIGRPLTIDWSGKFLEAENTVEKYKLYLSTSQGGHDIWEGQDDIPGTSSGFNMTRLNLLPGIQYYVNIIAYSYGGLHTTVSSDGFMVDHLVPVSGMVYDGIGRLDLEYQNSSTKVAAHWHGFIDTESGIQNYTWCVGTTNDMAECSVMDWIDVGLHVSASRKLSSAITQGTKIYNKIYATDNAGLVSKTILSDGVVMDSTPPVSEKFVHADENLAVNPSFENTAGSLIMWNDVNSTDICTIGDTYHPLSWQPVSSTCAAVVTSSSNLAKDGASFLFIKGNVQQQLVDVVTGVLYKVSFYSSHIPIWDSVAANKEGFVRFGNIKKIFLIYTKSYRRDGHGRDTRAKISWHRHTYYFKATEDKLNITIGSVDEKTGIFIDNLSVQKVTLTTDDTSGHITGHVVYLHEWSSIHGFWSFMDPESPIIDYTWAIGYAEGGTQLQSFTSEGLMNFGYNNNVTLVHNNFIYITVIATNAAGLKDISYSDPILVDLTPPIINFVYDGKDNIKTTTPLDMAGKIQSPDESIVNWVGAELEARSATNDMIYQLITIGNYTGADEESWQLNEVVANWNVGDAESGVKTCKWAIGYQPEMTNLLIFTEVIGTTAYKEFDYNILEGHTIYTTISCENNAGLFSILSSNGVRISEHPPSIDNALAEVLSEQATEYNPRSAFQGVKDSLRLKWSGFTDSIGLESYLVNFDDSRYDQMFFPTEQDISYVHYTKMSLTSDTSYTVTLKAINKIYLKSAAVIRNITVYTGVPLVDESKSLSVSWATNQVTASWASIFTSNHHLFYEVSAGTNENGVNVLQWQYTNQTSVTFGIPLSVKVSKGFKIYLAIRAVSTGGFYSHVKGDFTLP